MDRPPHPPDAPIRRHDPSDSPGERPLAGIRVVDLAQMIAGPGAALALGDYGAEVIKVEPPGGDGGRFLRTPAAARIEPPPLFAAYNRGKTTIRLDLRSKEGAERAWQLIGEADVVIESSTPGAMDRLGLGATAVRARYPRIVYASVSGFGDGPLARGRRGVDLIIQAESGMMALTGYPGGTPTKVGFTVVDAAAAHALCHGIIAALFRRERTGAGATVSLSLVDVALNLMAGPLADYLATGVQPARAGNSAPHTAPADVFPCSDGYLVVAAYLDEHWRRLVDLLGEEDLASDPRFADPVQRVLHRDALTERLNSHFRRAPRHEWLTRLQAAGILVARVNEFADVVSDPVLEESGAVIRQPDVRGVHSPVRFADQPRRSVTPMREVDQASLAERATR
jgi:crotonobetainyl-CoA:carnitine CoA-transferase CaiB-like acyl-CoA transferase